MVTLVMMVMQTVSIFSDAYLVIMSILFDDQEENNDNDDDHKGSHHSKKVQKLRTFSVRGWAQLHSTAFGGVFPNITEPILDDENSTKCKNLPPKVITSHQNR